MNRIRKLDKSVAELIAAGEVVERPSSIVKELVENSIDAGAGRISVEIRNGGTTYIRVTDDGGGIPAEDVPNAFVRHATSKVYTKEDLEAIGTMGFRGEALPSVAAMSRVEVLTRVAGELSGTRYVIEGMEQIERSEAGCPVGTTIVVRNLFYNTPARMKFLKSDTVEGNTIAALIDRLALAHPQIAFRFIREGDTKLSTPGDNQLLSAIRVVCGSEVASSLTQVSHQVGDILVEGYISKPSYSKPSRSIQHFFINDRYIRSKTCSLALEEAYKTRLMVGRFPLCVLKVALPYHEVDVNVHPAKIEVRFSDEKAVYDGVYSACKLALDALESLAIGQNKPKLNIFSLSDQDYSQMQQSFAIKPDSCKPALPISSQVVEELQSAPITQAQIKEYGQRFCRGEYKPSAPDHSHQNLHTLSKSAHQAPEEQPFKAEQAESHIDRQPKADDIEEQSLGSFRPPLPLASEVPLPAEVVPLEAVQEMPYFEVIGEVFHTYIVCQTTDAMVLVDKHAAHERYLYSCIKEEINTSLRQLSLLNHVVTLDAQDYLLLLEHLSTLSGLGIVADDFGGNSLIIREVAMALAPMPIKELLADIAQKIRNHSNDITPSRLDELLFSMACRCAVMAGDKSSPAELHKLASIALAPGGARYCPHGRPTIVELDERDIQRMFGRLG